MKTILALLTAASVLLGSGAPVTRAPRQPDVGVQGAHGHAPLSMTAPTPAARCDATTDYGDANGLALDAHDNIYVALSPASADANAAGGIEIQKWSPAGRLLATWTTPGARRGRGYHPAGVAVDGHGNIYVADANASRIIKLSATGQVLATWGAPGTAAGQFAKPAGIAVDGHGDVYVADKGNGRVQVLDATGRPRALWRLPSPGPGQASLPSGIAVDGRGRVYVADDAIRIFVLSPRGAVLRAWGSKGDQPDQFRHPVGIALDPRGRLDIADKLNARIQQFSPTGTPLTRWAMGSTMGRWFDAQGVAPAQPAFPTGVAVDARGTIDVLAGWCTSRIQQFSPTGQTIAIWPVAGT